ncbi:hydroxypyruvate isomerase family protein [Pusillimonas sp. SM2304]|uniref:2-oxo-tetronate isomerase n=1 Tax=Pusillimonas sp. SM2304 TaxID=3073241 RepID=UPI0028747EEA|nr:2-oxo-tetronate isomerase [Pusillimonas sp. SM2304]MDS1140639.1 hydroxypyruvate isomerase family protein [Pusillimonas sp. SM2304]
MPKLAANITMMFNELPFLARIQASAQAGFKAVEFLFPYDFDAQDIAAELKRHGLKNVLFNTPPGDWDAGERGIAALPGRSDEFRAGVAQAIAYAQALGTPNIHAMAGLLPAGADVDQCRATFIDNLEYAARQCAAHQINVLIEPINQRDMPGYFLSLQDQAHAIRQAVNQPNLKVQMDFYHAQIMEGDIAMTFRKFQPHVGHIQIAGVPERHEPDTGEVNYAYLFQLLDELGYDGWVGCEYRPAHGTVPGLGWMPKLLDPKK